MAPLSRTGEETRPDGTGRPEDRPGRTGTRVASIEDLSDVSSLLFHVLAGRWLRGGTEWRLSRWVVRLACVMLRRTSARTARHLSAYFGDRLTERQVVALARANLQHRWMQREIVWMYELSASAARRTAACQRVRIEGLQWLEEALREGRGAILWEGRLGNRVLAKVALAERGYRLCQVHDRRHGGATTWFGQRVTRRLFRRMEARLFPDVIDIESDSLGYLRSIAARLARNGIVCLSAMGEVGFKFVQHELLGRRRHFATGAVNLARMTGAALLPIVSLRLADGTEQVVIEEPIRWRRPGSGDGAIAHAVTHYIRLLEEHVRTHPEQWFAWD